MELTDYTFDTRIRRKHVPLVTHQRRLRHLNAILGRNITSNEITEGDNFGLFYTIHLRSDGNAIYTSETSEGNLNPMWQQLQLSKFNCVGSNASSSFVVKVWLTKRGDHCATCLIEWEVHLRGLSFLGEQVPKDGRKFLPNTLLFSMPEGIYGAADCIVQQGPKLDQSLYEVLYSDPSIVRNSCTVNSLKRMMTTERAIKQTQASVSRVRKAIEKKLQQQMRLHRIQAREEELRMRISLLEQNIEERCLMLQQEKQECQNRDQHLRAKEKELENIATELTKKRSLLVDQRGRYFEVREALLKTNSRLALRQKELISELGFIYPVVQFPDKKGYSICCVHLPNSEDFNDRDDLMISVALGYVTHTLLMMSHFLDVPLRYPLIHQGTNSSVRDNLIEHFSDKEREFPLYLKGKEKMMFNYSVYLLNRNIAQLRCNCNLATKDLRITLHNLYGLFEHYSIKVNSNSQLNSTPVAIPSTSLPVTIQKNNSSDATDNLSSVELPSLPLEPLPSELQRAAVEKNTNEEAPIAKLSSSLDKGLDQMQESRAAATAATHQDSHQLVSSTLQRLRGSYRSSEPNLQEFAARRKGRNPGDDEGSQNSLLPVPPVVYDAAEESASLQSGEDGIEVAVDTLFDAELTARTENLANVVRSFRTYSMASSNGTTRP